jgi:hypothetical protein
MGLENLKSVFQDIQLPENLPTPEFSPLESSYEESSMVGLMEGVMGPIGGAVDFLKSPILGFTLRMNSQTDSQLYPQPGYIPPVDMIDRLGDLPSREDGVNPASSQKLGIEPYSIINTQAGGIPPQDRFFQGLQILQGILKFPLTEKILDYTGRKTGLDPTGKTFDRFDDIVTGLGAGSMYYDAITQDSWIIDKDLGVFGKVRIPNVKQFSRAIDLADIVGLIPGGLSKRSGYRYTDTVFEYPTRDERGAFAVPTSDDAPEVGKGLPRFANQTRGVAFQVLGDNTYRLPFDGQHKYENTLSEKSLGNLVSAPSGQYFLPGGEIEMLAPEVKWESGRGFENQHRGVIWQAVGSNSMPLHNQRAVLAGMDLNFNFVAMLDQPLNYAYQDRVLREKIDMKNTIDFSYQDPVVEQWMLDVWGTVKDMGTRMWSALKNSNLDFGVKGGSGQFPLRIGGWKNPFSIDGGFDADLNVDWSRIQNALENFHQNSGTKKISDAAGRAAKSTRAALSKYYADKMEKHVNYAFSGEWWSKLTSWIKGGATNLNEQLGIMMNNLGQWATDAGNQLARDFGALGDGIKAVYEYGKAKAGATFQKLSDWGSAFGEWFGKLARGGWEGTKNIIRRLYEGGKSGVSATWDAAQTTWGTIGDVISPMSHFLRDGVKGILAIGRGVQNFLAEMMDPVGRAIRNIGGLAVDAIGSALRGGANFVEGTANIVIHGAKFISKPFVDFGAKAAKQISEDWELFKNTFKNKGGGQLVPPWPNMKWPWRFIGWQAVADGLRDRMAAISGFFSRDDGDREPSRVGKFFHRVKDIIARSMNAAAAGIKGALGRVGTALGNTGRAIASGAKKIAGKMAGYGRAAMEITKTGLSFIKDTVVAVGTPMVSFGKAAIGLMLEIGKSVGLAINDLPKLKFNMPFTARWQDYGGDAKWFSNIALGALRNAISAITHVSRLKSKRERVKELQSMPENTRRGIQLRHFGNSPGFIVDMDKGLVVADNGGNRVGTIYSPLAAFPVSEQKLNFASSPNQNPDEYAYGPLRMKYPRPPYDTDPDDGTQDVGHHRYGGIAPTIELTQQGINKGLTTTPQIDLTSNKYISYDDSLGTDGRGDWPDPSPLRLIGKVMKNLWFEALNEMSQPRKGSVGRTVKPPSINNPNAELITNQADVRVPLPSYGEIPTQPGDPQYYGKYNNTNTTDGSATGQWMTNVFYPGFLEGKEDIHTLHPTGPIEDLPLAVESPQTGYPFYFKDMRTNDFVVFRGYVQGLSENVNGSWNPENYIGRSEPVYIYQRGDRQLNFTLRMFAMSKAQLEMIYHKLNRLTSLCYPQYQPDGNMNGKSRMKPPLTRFRLGELFGNEKNHGVLGFIESISYSYPDNSPWEHRLGKRVPKLIDATVSYRAIHDKVPNLETQFYGFNSSAEDEFMRVHLGGEIPSTPSITGLVDTTLDNLV